MLQNIKTYYAYNQPKSRISKVCGSGYEVCAQLFSPRTVYRVPRTSYRIPFLYPEYDLSAQMLWYISTGWIY